MVDRLLALLLALDAEVAPPTRIRAPSEALDRHVADGLSGLRVPAISLARRIADVGSGAGFPGLVIAAALSEASVDLIESTARKCEVIARLANAAGLSNAHPIPHRAEEWAAADGAEAYDVVTARAVAPLAVLAEYAAPLLRLGGSLIAWKGERDPEEEANGGAAAALLGLVPAAPVGVRPFSTSRARALHVYRKEHPTPANFPRRPGMAAKRPLATHTRPPRDG